MADNLATVVAAICIPLQRCFAMPVELVDDIMPPIPHPMHHTGQNIRRDVVTLSHPSRRGDPGGLPHVPNLAVIGLVSVHALGESQARIGMAVVGGLAQPLRRPPPATRHAAP
jgi:hypothetical protein